MRSARHNGVQAAVDVQGFLFVPGWTFLGATYDAVLVQPFVMASVGQPLNLNPALPSRSLACTTPISRRSS